MNMQEDREPVLTPLDPRPASFSSDILFIGEEFLTQPEIFEEDEQTARKATPRKATPREATPPERRPLNISDALLYLVTVQTELGDQPDVYKEFLDVMRDFNTKEVDPLRVIGGIIRVFKEHPALIHRFNTFLPVGYHIQCSTEAGFVTITAPIGGRTQTAMSVGGGQATPARVDDEPPVAPAGEIIHPVQYWQNAGLHRDRDTGRQSREIGLSGLDDIGQHLKELERLLRVAGPDVREELRRLLIL